jgi:hypothetical protein
MKRLVCAGACMLVAGTVLPRQTAPATTDTVKVGNFIIIKKKGNSDDRERIVHTDRKWSQL